MRVLRKSRNLVAVVHPVVVAPVKIGPVAAAGGLHLVVADGKIVLVVNFGVVFGISGSGNIR